MSIPTRADINIGIVNQYTLNPRGGVEGVGQTVIDFYDPTLGLPAAVEGDRYVSLATANGWIQNYISVYTDDAWKVFSPLPGAILWFETPSAINIWNDNSGTWEDGLTFFGAMGSVTPPVTNNAIPRFSGTSGQTLKTSSVIVDDTGNVAAGSATIGATSITSTGAITGVPSMTTTGALTVGGTLTRGTTSIDGAGNLVVGGTLTRSPTTIDGTGAITGVPSITTTGAVTVGGTLTRGTTSIDGAGNLVVGGTLTRSPTTIDGTGAITGVPSITTTGAVTVGGTLTRGTTSIDGAGNLIVGGTFTRGSTTIDSTGTTLSTVSVNATALSATSALISGVQISNNAIFGITYADLNYLRVGVNGANFNGRITSNDPYITLNSTSASNFSAGLITTRNQIITSTGILTTPGFVAGVAGVSNPTVSTIATVFSPGQLIRIQNSTTNNGIYEVLSHVGSTLTIRGVGLTPTVENFTETNFVTESGTGSAILVDVSVIQVNDQGVLETYSGTVTGNTPTTIARSIDVVSKIILLSPFDSYFLVNIPTGATHMWVTAWAGGGAGGASRGLGFGGGGGGGAGGAVVRFPVNVTGLTLLSCRIGSGGTYTVDGDGTDGGFTEVGLTGKTIRVDGGKSGGNGSTTGTGSGGGGAGGGIIIGGSTQGGNGVGGVDGTGGVGESATTFDILFSSGSGSGSNGNSGVDGGNATMNTFIVGGAGGGGGAQAISSAGNGGSNIGGSSVNGDGSKGGTGAVYPKGGGGGGGFYGGGGDGNDGNNSTDPGAFVTGANSGAGGGGGASGGIGALSPNRNGGGGGIILEFA